jgi:hypothetical protein
MFPPSLCLSLVFTWKMWKKPKSGWSISHYFSCHHTFSIHLRKALANQKCRFRMICGLIARQKLSLVMPGIKSLSRQQKWSLFDDHVQQDRRPTSKIDLCVILHISSLLEKCLLVTICSWCCKLWSHNGTYSMTKCPFSS